MSNPETYQLYRWDRSLPRQTVLDRIHHSGLGGSWDYLAEVKVFARAPLENLNAIGSNWMKSIEHNIWIDLRNLKEIKGPIRRHHKRKAKTHALTT